MSIKRKEKRKLRQCKIKCRFDNFKNCTIKTYLNYRINRYLTWKWVKFHCCLYKRHHDIINFLSSRKTKDLKNRPWKLFQQIRNRQWTVSKMLTPNNRINPKLARNDNYRLIKWYKRKDKKHWTSHCWNYKVQTNKKRITKRFQNIRCFQTIGK